MVLILKTCGCGLTLKTGTIIIGVLQALGGFAVLVSESVSAYRTEYVAPFPKNEIQLPRVEDDGLKTYVKDRKELCAILAITGGIQLILSILLLYGADYESPKLIRPWVIFSMIMTGVMMLTYIGLAILTFVWGFDRIGSRIFLGLILASDIRAMSIITVVIGAVQMFLGYLLISGADKGKHNQIKLWIIVTIITGVIFSLVVSLYMVLVSLMLTGSTGLFAVFLLLALPVLAVAYYSLLVVHSYYKTLRDALENSVDDSIEMSRF